MVTDHLDHLQNHRFNEIAKAMRLPLEEVIHHCEIIRRLDPQPGSKFTNEKSFYVTPDVYVVKVDGKWEIVLNEDRLPQLRISPIYRRMLENKSEENHSTREYVKEKLRSALWLIKSVDQRQKTIYKVANSIVHQQQDFLDHGVEHLKPMVLRDVAIDIGMHESTVSRVVANKYIHTVQGVFDMKYFFIAASPVLAGTMSRRSRSNGESRKSSKRRTLKNLSPIPRSSGFSRTKASFWRAAPSLNTEKSFGSRLRTSERTSIAARLLRDTRIHVRRARSLTSREYAMLIQITARHMDVPAKLKAYIENRVEKLDKFIDGITDVRVTLSTEKYRQIAELNVRSRGAFICPRRKRART